MNNLAFLSCAHIHTQNYFDKIAGLDGATISAVWDDLPDRGRRFADKADTEFVEDLDAILAREDIAGYVICAENTRHWPLLNKAIHAGRPIFVEKPLTVDPAEAQQTLDLSRQHNVPVVCGYFWPFAAEMQSAAKLLAEGELGRVTHARCRNAHHAAYGRWFDSEDLAWFTQPDLAGGGALMDMGTHAVHLMRSLLGPVRAVWARIENLSGQYPQTDDFGLAMLEFESGVLGQVEAAWVHTGGPRGLEILGSQKALFLDGASGRYVTGISNHEPTPAPPAEARPIQIERLLAVIDSRVDPAEVNDDLQCSVDTVKILDACYRSAQVGGWVAVQ